MQSPNATDSQDRALVVALHGQGMTAAGFLHILRELATANTALLVPEGPYPYEMRRDGAIKIGYSWYLFDGDQEAFRTQLEQSESHLLRICSRVAREQRAQPERTVLLGFSQGGYLAGFTALRHPRRFGGLVLASARLKSEFLEEELCRGDAPKTLVLHSETDTGVSWEHASEHVQRLVDAGADVEIFLHEGGHRLPPAAVQRVADWLLRKRFHDARPA